MYSPHLAHYNTIETNNLLKKWWIFVCIDLLDTAYFAEIKNLLLKVL